MTDRERYNKLDDIGFVGGQGRSAAQVKKDAELTSRHIQAMKEKEAKSKKATRGKKAIKVNKY